MIKCLFRMAFLSAPMNSLSAGSSGLFLHLCTNPTVDSHQDRQTSSIGHSILFVFYCIYTCLSSSGFLYVYLLHLLFSVLAASMNAAWIRGVILPSASLYLERVVSCIIQRSIGGMAALVSSMYMGVALQALSTRHRASNWILVKARAGGCILLFLVGMWYIEHLQTKAALITLVYISLARKRSHPHIAAAETLKAQTQVFAFFSISCVCFFQLSFQLSQIPKNLACSWLQIVVFLMRILTGVGFRSLVKWISLVFMGLKYSPDFIDQSLHTFHAVSRRPLACFRSLLMLMMFMLSVNLTVMVPSTSQSAL